jgi:hypothetical protein
MRSAQSQALSVYLSDPERERAMRRKFRTLIDRQLPKATCPDCGRQDCWVRACVTQASKNDRTPRLLGYAGYCTACRASFPALGASDETDR